MLEFGRCSVKYLPVKIVFPLAMVLVGTGCATATLTEENSVTLRAGMTKQEVQSVLGGPTYNYSEDGETVWIYVERDVGHLLFKPSRDEPNTVRMHNRLARQMRESGRPYRTGDYRLELRFRFDAGDTVLRIQHSLHRDYRPDVGGMRR